MPDRSFARSPVELILFSNIHNGLFNPAGMTEGERALDIEAPTEWRNAVLPDMKFVSTPISSHLYPEIGHCWDCIDVDRLSKADFKGDRVLYRYDARLTEDSRRRMFEFFGAIR